MKKWYEIRNQTQDMAELYFYGDIVSDEWEKWEETDKCPMDITNMLAECKDAKRLNIYINSNGGNVFGGVAIHNILKRFSGKKIVHIDGLAASIATIIALAGDEVRMPSNAYFMIHNAWSVAMGNADELRKAASDLDKINESIVNIYSDYLRDGVDIKTIKALMDNETWLTAKETAGYFKNVVVTKANKAAACISEYKYKNIPESVVITNKKQDLEHNLAEKKYVDVEIDMELIKNFIKMEESINE